MWWLYISAWNIETFVHLGWIHIMMQSLALWCCAVIKFWNWLQCSWRKDSIRSYPCITVVFDDVEGSVLRLPYNTLTWCKEMQGFVSIYKVWTEHYADIRMKILQLNGRGTAKNAYLINCWWLLDCCFLWYKIIPTA